MNHRCPAIAVELGSPEAAIFVNPLIEPIQQAARLRRPYLVGHHLREGAELGLTGDQFGPRYYPVGDVEEGADCAAMLAIEDDRLGPILDGDCRAVQPVEQFVDDMRRGCITRTAVNRAVCDIVVSSIGMRVVKHVVKLATDGLVGAPEPHQIYKGGIAKRGDSVPVYRIECLRAGVQQEANVGFTFF